MLALQVRVAPSFLVAACLSDSRLNVRSKTQNHNNIAILVTNWYLLTHLPL